MQNAGISKDILHFYSHDWHYHADITLVAGYHTFFSEQSCVCVAHSFIFFPTFLSPNLLFLKPRIFCGPLKPELMRFHSNFSPSCLFPETFCLPDAKSSQTHPAEDNHPRSFAAILAMRVYTMRGHVVITRAQTYKSRQARGTCAHVPPFRHHMTPNVRPTSAFISLFLVWYLCSWSSRCLRHQVGTYCCPLCILPRPLVFCCSKSGTAQLGFLHSAIFRGNRKSECLPEHSLLLGRCCALLAHISCPAQRNHTLHA